MKVYLASRFSTKLQMSAYADELRAKGVEVTSRWLEEPTDANANLGDISERSATEYAYQDLVDIAAADILVFFSVEPTTPTLRGGRHVEFGYAYGIRKLILIVGPKENIFHSLREIKRVDTWPEAVHFLLRKKQSRSY